MSTFSEEHKTYLKKKKREKIFIILLQVFIVVGFIIIWEMAARFEWINSFLTSSPSNVVKTIQNLFQQNDLFKHIWITVYETIVSFGVASILGLIISTIFWWFPKAAKVSDPFLTVLNSLPKVALGPLIIIWVGASTNSIIFMALMICVFVSIINIYNGFIATNKNYLTLMKSFGSTKSQTFFKVILPSNKKNIFNALKINISMSLIGVIMGELLVSKAGLGYLIMYGSQVFNINLVITGVVILGIISYVMYYIVNKLEQKTK